MDTHPYIEFTSFKAWAILAQALSDLEDNKDIILNTRSEYIIGYIMKSLSEKGLLKIK